MKRILAALAFVTAPLAAWSEDITTFTLDNGMEVVVIEDHRAPVVVHMVWYRVGSADEPVGASGVAHFLEHLLFKQTDVLEACLLYTSPSPRDKRQSRMPSSA